MDGSRGPANQSQPAHGPCAITGFHGSSHSASWPLQQPRVGTCCACLCLRQVPALLLRARLGARLLWLWYLVWLVRLLLNVVMVVMFLLFDLQVHMETLDDINIQSTAAVLRCGMAATAAGLPGACVQTQSSDELDQSWRQAHLNSAEVLQRHCHPGNSRQFCPSHLS